jgi:hypothetical protein
MKKKKILILAGVITFILITLMVIGANSKTISGKNIKEITEDQFNLAPENDLEKKLFEKEIKLSTPSNSLCSGQDSKGFCQVLCETGGCSCIGSQCQCEEKLMECQRTYEETTRNFWGKEIIKTREYYSSTDPFCCMPDPSETITPDKY